MARISTKIPKNYRYYLYLSLALSCLSGTAFWLLRNYGFVEGDFGPEAHFLQYPALQLHGFAAFSMLLCLGAIFTAHIPNTWYAKRAKNSGVILTTVLSLSALSAYSLYYLVNEDWHELLGNSHAALGLILPLFLILHVKVARKSRKKSPLNNS